MKSIKNKLSVFKTLGMIVVLSILVLPLAPLTALAVSDITAPTIAITAPVNGATVSGVVAVSANATDLAIPASDCIVTIFGTLYDVTPLQGSHSGGNVFVCGTDMTSTYQGMHGTNVSRMTPYVIPQSGISKVEWYLDGVLKNSTTTTPYTFAWDTTTTTNGSHSLSAKAYDAAGNVGTSTIVTISVKNGIAVTPPKHPGDNGKEHGNKYGWYKHEKKDKKDKKEHKKELKNHNSHEDEDEDEEDDD
ncbi:MAG: Ig-like domain-containing protein [Candidatus Paceibacterota bacterium]